MGVMYLFDSMQKVRAAIVDSVKQCIHHEADHALEATIPSAHAAEPGEYLGFLCVDGRWRLFCITTADDDDEEGLCYIKATDAAVDDLQHIVVPEKRQEDITAQEAAEALLEGTEWQLATVTADDATNTTDAKWVSLWQALLTLAEVFEVQVEPYYIIEDGEITGKKIDLLKDEPVFRGRLYESRINASDVRRIKRNRPVTVLYGLGKAMGTGDEAENITFADVEWSIANGDPADKPKGQSWVEDAEASAVYGRRENVLTIGDIEEPEKLLKKTWETLQERKKPEITVEMTIHDAEQMHGGEWRAVRRGDLVIVRTQQGIDAETRVINIARDYAKPEQTKFTSGKELPKATNQVSGLVRTSIKTQETLTVYRNRFIHDEALIALYADTIIAHADTLLHLQAGVDENAAIIALQDGKITSQAKEISENAQKITETAGDVDELHTTVTVEADGLRQSIQQGSDIIASLKSTIDGLEHWVTDADGNVAELTNTVRGLESKITTADGKLSILTNTADGLTAMVFGQNDDISQLMTRADEISAAVKDAGGGIGSLSVKADSVTAKVKSVGDQVSQLAVNADGLAYTLTKQGQELTSIKAQIDEISLAVKDANGAIGQFAVQSDRIAGKLQDTSGKLTALMELTDNRISAVLGDIETISGEVSGIKGSALWQTRNSITGVVGKMTVGSDGSLYIKEGSGLKVYKNGAAYGVYDENNLTAGLLVQKLNGSTTAKIKADRIELDGYVQMTDFETLSGSVSDLTAGLTTASWIRTQNLDVSIKANVWSLQADFADFGALNLNGTSMTMRSMNVVRSLGTISQNKRYLNVRLADGGTAQLDIVTDVSITPSTGTIQYLGYDNAS